jgi:hypothetical protein
MKKILFAAAILAFGFTSASAQYDSRYDDRDRNNSEYHDRYRDGHRGGHDMTLTFCKKKPVSKLQPVCRRGTLSSREANALMNEYDRIEARERPVQSPRQGVST